jgi:hypothetical protein
MNKLVKEHMTRTESEAVAAALASYVSSQSVNDKSLIDTTEHVITKAFRADFWHARSRDEWVAIGNALDSNYLERVGEKRVKLAFRRLAREGVILGRKSAGKYIYEMNLNWGL